MEVKFAELKHVFEAHQKEYEEAALRVLRSGWYVLGDELKAFEADFAKYIGMKHGVGVNSGQDALILAIRALGIGPGDEVITQGNAYIASVFGITENGATPVFVEPDAYFGLDPQKIEAAITPRTKAILPVHLYGQPCDMPAIRAIADKYHLYVVEDCAQCHGSTVDGQMAGTFSDISCFSFYPTKPLGAFGDAGMALTNSDALDEKLRMLRFYGSRVKYVSEITGVNSRLDELQAAILSVGLQHLEEGNKTRQKIADAYLTGIVNPLVQLPQTRKGCTHVYHIFAVLCAQRDALRKHLEEKGVRTQIHYPVPPHLAPCYAYFGHKRGDYEITERYADQEVSLPIYVGLSEVQIQQVIDAINSFKG